MMSEGFGFGEDGGNATSFELDILGREWTIAGGMESMSRILPGQDTGPNEFNNDGDITFLAMLEKYDIASDCIGIPQIDKSKLA